MQPLQGYGPQNSAGIKLDLLCRAWGVTQIRLTAVSESRRKSSGAGASTRMAHCARTAFQILSLSRIYRSREADNASTKK